MARPKNPGPKPETKQGKGSRSDKIIIRVTRPALPDSLEQGVKAVEGLRDFIARMGAQVEPALYSLICDQQHPLRANIDKALAGGMQAAMLALAPQLVSEYRFSLVTATTVAAFAAQQVAAKGQSMLCAELAAHRAGGSGGVASGGSASQAGSLFAEPVREPEPEEKPVKKPKPKPPKKPRPTKPRKPKKPNPRPVKKPKGGKK